MIFGSVCSGIGCADLAFHRLGWRCAFMSEIEAFPRAVLTHRFPGVPLHGDFTTIKAGDYDAIDLLVGGTPCQSFSVAGLRAGLADERGNLALEYLRLADRLRPRWLVWENVPGVLSSSGGRDFGAFLGGLGELGYGFAYRVLDAQHFGVPQRRRRVFVVGYLGDWRRAAAVLFEPHSMQGHPAPRREAGERVAAAADGGIAGRRVAGTLNAAFGSKLGLDNQHIDNGCPLFVAHTLRGDGFDAGEDGTGRGTPLVPVDLQNGALGGAVVGTLDTTRPTRGGGQALMQASAVRRLTPRECERLQGLPDDWTLIPYRNRQAADAPRYKAIGNGMAVPCLAWIGRRISAVKAQQRSAAA